MALIKVNPLFTDLAEATNRLNRLFGREDPWETEGLVNRGDYLPPVDILETDREITMKVDLPGIEAKDVSLSVENNVLTFKGERRAEKEIKKENYHRMERAYGNFSRSFTLPAYIDTEKVKADFKNGLLTITLPKKEVAKGRTVEVNAA